MSHLFLSGLSKIETIRVLWRQN